MERIEGYRNFCNKVWNAARFILMNLPEGYKPISPDPDRLNNERNRWVLSRLRECVEFVNRDLDEYRFDQAAQRLYGFIWHEFCDWYVEMAKGDLADPYNREETLSVLIASFETLLRLLHPFMPFITEEIWHHLTHEGEMIMLARYPTLESARYLKEDKSAEMVVGKMMEIVNGIRNFRSEMRLPPSMELEAVVASFISAAISKSGCEGQIKRLARLKTLKLENQNSTKPIGTATIIHSSGDKVYLTLAGQIDGQAEKQRITKLLEKAEKDLESLNAKLENPDFKVKAQPDAVNKVQQQQADLWTKRKQYRQELQWIEEIASTNLPEGTSS
jgi:valyl-tRNA synthetase